jgi:hypothetical protein
MATGMNGVRQMACRFQATSGTLKNNQSDQNSSAGAARIREILPQIRWRAVPA